MDSIVEKLVISQQNIESCIETLLSGSYVLDFTNMDNTQYNEMYAILERYCKGWKEHEKLRECKQVWDKAFIESRKHCKEGLIMQIESGNDLKYLDHPSWRSRIVKLCVEEVDEIKRQAWLHTILHARIFWTKEEIQDLPLSFCIDCIKALPVNQPPRANMSKINMEANGSISDEFEEEYPNISRRSVYSMGPAQKMLLYIVRYHFTAIEEEGPQLIEEVLKKWYRTSIAYNSKVRHILPGKQIRMFDESSNQELCAYIQDVYRKNIFSCIIQNRRQILYRYGDEREITTRFHPCPIMDLLNTSFGIEFPHLCYVFPTRIHIKHAKYRYFQDKKKGSNQDRFRISTGCYSIPIGPYSEDQKRFSEPDEDVEQETTTILMKGEICKSITINAKDEKLFDVKVFGTVMFLF